MAQNRVDFHAYFEKHAPDYENANAFMKDIVQEVLSIVPAHAGSVVHDNACGTGFVTDLLLQQRPDAQPAEIYATDFSEAMIEQMRAKARFSQRIYPQVMDSEALDFPDDKFTYSFMTFGIFFVKDPEKAVAEVLRTLKHGGVAVLTCWEKLGHLDIVRDAALAVRPDEGDRTTMLRSFNGKWLENVVKSAGAKDVEIRLLSHAVRGKKRDVHLDLMRESWDGQITKGWSEEEAAQYRKGFDEKVRAMKDGDIPLMQTTAVAIIHKGKTR